MKKFFSFQRQKAGDLGNVFSKYISKETLYDIIEGKHNIVEQPFKKGTINFVLIQLKGEPIEELQDLHKSVVSTILENNGFVVGIISTIVFATFGFPFQDNKNAANSCEQTAYSLLRSLGNEIKVIYGSEEGFYGNCPCRAALIMMKMELRSGCFRIYQDDFFEQHFLLLFQSRTS